MNKHAELRSRPDRLPWLRAKIKGEVFVFKLPPASASASAAKRYSEASRAAGSAETFDLAAMERASAELIRLCWDDETWQLEATEPEVIVQELWEFGWDASILVHVATALVENIAVECAYKPEAAKLVDFSSARGRNAHGSSPSGTNTSETPGPGIDSPTPSGQS